MLPLQHQFKGIPVVRKYTSSFILYSGKKKVKVGTTKLLSDQDMQSQDKVLLFKITQFKYDLRTQGPAVNTFFISSKGEGNAGGVKFLTCGLHYFLYL